MKITFVKQEQEHGCVPACLAMIRGVDYWRVAQWFENKFTHDGIKLETAMEYLSHFGYQIIVKEVWTGNHPLFGQAEMTKPFAPIHIVSVKPFADSKTNHSVIMSKSGRIYDPSSVMKSFADIWEVQRILGVWPK